MLTCQVSDLRLHYCLRYIICCVDDSDDDDDDDDDDVYTATGCMYCSLAAEALDVSRIADRTLILVRHGEYDLNNGQLTALGQ